MSQALASYARGESKKTALGHFLASEAPGEFPGSLQAWIGGSHVQRSAFEATYASLMCPRGGLGLGVKKY